PARGAGTAGPRVAEHDTGVHSHQRREAEEGVQRRAPAGLGRISPQRIHEAASMTAFHGTTILAVRKDGRVALGGDGQVSIGDTVMKSKSVKVRTLKGGKVFAGF